MTNKVAVSYEIKLALDQLLKIHTSSYILEKHLKVVKKEDRWIKHFIILNDLPFETMAFILLSGYEETPESKYNFFYKKYSQSELQLEKDFLAGMKFVADMFNLNVEGRTKNEPEESI